MSWIKLDSEHDESDKYEYYGNIYYFKKNTRIPHNPYGPSYIDLAGYKVYYIEGKIHRLDGPARIFPSGRGDHWINGKFIKEEEFELHPERLKFLDKEYLLCPI